jgi:hypothetical protein
MLGRPLRLSLGACHGTPSESQFGSGGGIDAAESVPATVIRTGVVRSTECGSVWVAPDAPGASVLFVNGNGGATQDVADVRPSELWVC